MAKAHGDKTTAAAATEELPKSESVLPAAASSGSTRLFWLNRGLLLGAVFSALLVYGACLNAGWFYDDQDYVLLDPRVTNLKLFLPGNWSKPPPELDTIGGQNLILPGYDKPLIFDRYLWHLSFALERVMFGEDYGPRVAHAVNILIHLSCIVMLFFALSRLVRLYAEESERKRPGSVSAYWKLLPGMAALIFAVHPWAAEPVCYVSARNGGMGAFFCLTGLWLFAGGFEAARSLRARILFFGGALFCAVLAYGCRENFIAAPAGYMLAVWPLIFGRYWNVSRARTLAMLGGALAALLCIAWLGIQYSDRARGLLGQVTDSGWRYFFEIQSPTLLLTLTDHLPCRRLAIETGFPGWAAWACWMAVFANIALLLLGTIGGRITPLLLGLGWYYVFLLPSNSFLPRPDFLAGRNVYLPSAGVSVLLAGAVVWALSLMRPAASASTSQNWSGGVQAMPPRSSGAMIVAAIAALSWLYWGYTAHGWAAAFLEPEQVWERSAEVSPDHSVLRINLAIELIRQTQPDKMQPKERKRLEKELRAALDGEETPTMQFHGPRPKQMVRSLAWRLLGDMSRSEERYDDAEDCYRRSWEQQHALPTWLNWLQTALDGKMSAKQTAILDEGFREWPNEWWPKVAHDTTQALNWRQAHMTPQMQLDFEAAERAPDALDSGLRNLQMQVIMVLTQQSIANKPLARARIERLKELGAAEEQIDMLEKNLDSQP